jgi:SAM-dependent methyltransferase
LSSIYSNSEYLSKNQDWHQEDSPYKACLVIRSLERSNISFSKVLDWGCGAGEVTRILADKFPNADFKGIDISKDVAQFWRNKKRDNLSFENQTNETFDLAICLDVFEHVDDYIGFIRDLGTRAKYIIFNVPLDMNVSKLLTSGLKIAREEVGHLHYFNYFTAISTIEYCGYTIKDYFLSAAFTKTRPRNIRQLILLFPRLATLLLGKKFASVTFGGISLVACVSTQNIKPLAGKSNI